MKRHTLSLWLGGVLWTASVSVAQAAELSLPQTLLAAEHYSAALSANRNQSDALNAMADSARQLPDPKLKFGIENVPVQGSNNHRFSRDGMTMQRIGIMQDYVSEEKRDRKAETILAQSAGGAQDGGLLRRAIHDGAVLRVRPKVMTVATIMAGLLPIMWGNGTGSEVMRRIAAPMIGGMVTAPLLSMLVIPAVYLLIKKRQ